jgi:hypothetical protein
MRILFSDTDQAESFVGDINNLLNSGGAEHVPIR